MSLLGKLPRLAAFVVLAALCQSASADPFASAAYANTSSKYKDVKSGSGFAGSLGYEFDRIPIFVEAEYLHSGKLDYEFLSGEGVKYNGGQFFAGYDYNVRDIHLWLKGGLYTFDGKTSFGSTTETGFTLGIGGDWMFARDFGVRFDIETPFHVDPGPGLNTGAHTELSIIKIGVVWRPSFGKSSTRSASSRSESLPVSASDPATPADKAAPSVPSAPAPSAPAAAATPAATVAAPAASTGIFLRQRPVRTAPVTAKIGSIGEAKLQQSVSNADGTWWYAVLPSGKSGWILDADKHR